MRCSSAAALFLLAPGLQAQSFNIDFGSLASSHGAPADAYRAAGPAGHWNAVGPAGAASLIDAGGIARAVTVTFTGAMTAEECDHAATFDDDDALLDDRLEFPPAFHGGVGIDFSDLAPGLYRVLVYSIHGAQAGCFPDTLFVRVDGSWEEQLLNWSGAFEENESYTLHSTYRPDGGTLRVHVEGNAYGTVWISGLQIEHSPIPSARRFGGVGGWVGSDACPCGNGSGTGGCSNSTGKGGRLDTVGSNCLSTDDLVVVARDLVPGEAALLFVGTETLAGAAGAPFGDGRRYVAAPVARLGIAVTDAAGTVSWGPGLGARCGLDVGSRYFQVWYRDSGGSPCGWGFNLTDALQVDYIP